MNGVRRTRQESGSALGVAQKKISSRSRQSDLASALDESPMVTAQRKRLQRLFGANATVEGGSAVQRVEEDELPLQGRFEGVQRAEDEEPLQGRFAVQRVEDEEPLQGRFVAQRVEEEEPLQGRFDGEPPKANETGLPDNLKGGIESLSGFSLDNVRVHYNSSQPAQLNALAYAQGTDIHVAPGQEQHLPHEAWHLVQQAQGRVEPTMQAKGTAINDDPGLEHEADVMGAKALQVSTRE